MKHICTRCERQSDDGNLWCQEMDCPAEEMPIVFSYGQHVGDVKINRLIKVLRTSALYEAERAGAPVLLKVAHSGCEDQLRREADTLRQLQGGGTGQSHAALPRLLAAYEESNIKQHPYGKAIVQDHTLYFEVFDHVEGQILGDQLNENPQPWYEHAAWITIALADVIAFLHSRAHQLHLCLSPECVLVRKDDSGIYRPVLIDLGLLITETAVEDLEWLHDRSLPAYTPPELTYTTPDTIDSCLPATPASDVYALSLLLYEMLAGYPVFEYRHQRDSDVRDRVHNHKPRPLTRRDLPDEIHIIIERALSRLPRERYQDVVSFGRDLRRYFGEVPAEKKRRTAAQKLFMFATAGAMVFALVILIAAILS